MKQKVTLTITSLLTMLLFALHWADDVVRGFAVEPATRPVAVGAVLQAALSR